MQSAGLFAEPLRDGVLVGRGVYGRADGGGVDETGPVLATSLEEVERRARVLANGAGRIGVRARRIRDTGEVEDGIAAG
jgi:hypothetical protein